MQQTTFPGFDDQSQNFTDEERKIIGLLPEGSNNPRSLAMMADLAGISERRLRALIYHLVTDKALPIGSQSRRPGGYYWITNDEERAQSAARLNSQAREMYRRSRAIDRVALISKRDVLKRPGRD